MKHLQKISISRSAIFLWPKKTEAEHWTWGKYIAEAIVFVQTYGTGQLYNDTITWNAYVSILHEK